MKKYIALLLCVLMVATCFVGCGKQEEPVDLVVWTSYAEGTPAYDVAFEKAAEFYSGTSFTRLFETIYSGDGCLRCGNRCGSLSRPTTSSLL